MVAGEILDKAGHDGDVIAGLSRVLATCQHIRIDVALADLLDKHAGAKALSSRNVFAGGEDQATRGFRRAETPVGSHAAATCVVALRADNSICALMPPCYVVGPTARGEVVDYRYCVLGGKEQTLQGVVGAVPRAREVSSVEFGPKVLLDEGGHFALEHAAGPREVEPEVARRQNSSKRCDKTWHRNFIRSQLQPLERASNRGHQCRPVGWRR
jgi:hypothetical protein